MEEDMGQLESEQEEAMKNLYAFVVEHMKAGDDKFVISQKLAEMGVDIADASQLVETIHSQILEAAKVEQFTFSSILPVLIGAVLAATVGGVIWGLIVIATEYVIGFMAWGIGLICGFAVVLFSKGKRGMPLQVIAVLASVLGIVIGKYFTFFHYLKELVAKEYGAEAASDIAIFSVKMIQFFVENIESMVSGFDIVWVVLAVITAWRIPKGTGIKLSK